MTNAEIIEREAVELMKQGKIGTTGRMFKATFLDAEGNERVEMIPEPEKIHTFAHWKTLGFQVKKGEHAVAKFGIWKYASKTVEDENGNEIDKSHMFPKTAYFFSRSQVEPMKDCAC